MIEDLFLFGAPWAIIFDPQGREAGANDVVEYVGPTGTVLTLLFNDETLARTFEEGDAGQRLAEEETRDVRTFRVKNREGFDKLLGFFHLRRITHVRFNANGANPETFSVADVRDTFSRMPFDTF